MKKEITIKNWSELTLIDYIQIMNLSESKMNEVTKLNAIIAITSGMEIDELMGMDYRAYLNLANSLEFMNKLPDSVLQPYYEIGGVTYRVQYDMNKISTQQYIDMLALSKEDLIPNIHKILSLFLIPCAPGTTALGFKKHIPAIYGTYDVEEVADILLNNLTIDIGYALMVFFYHLYEDLTKATVLYSIKELMKMKIPKVLRKRLKAILKGGVGSEQLTELQAILTEAGIKYGL